MAKPPLPIKRDFVNKCMMFTVFNFGLRTPDLKVKESDSLI